ncbi:TonB-dependent receptor plug domain-containing protein [Delftia acidovorans]|uniref:TonB-dependent receptor plug domain-containing protein n=1 Tax=Delftia acidovorans TaxID=80866 RepID=UPI0039B55D35
MRGCGTTGSIFIDRVRNLGSPMRDTFNIEDIEDIEIVKGASGSEYGRRRPGARQSLRSRRQRCDHGPGHPLCRPDQRRPHQDPCAVRLHGLGAQREPEPAAERLQPRQPALHRQPEQRRRAPHPGRGALGQAGRRAEVPRPGCCWAATAIHSLIRLFLYFY